MIIDECSENHTKPIATVWGENREVFSHPTNGAVHTAEKFRVMRILWLTWNLLTFPR